MKIHVLGSPGVGKTTLLQLLKGEPFRETYEPTLKDVYYDVEMARIHYEVWDGAKCTDFSKANLVILVFDVSNHQSFQYARNTYLQIKDDVPVLFMGNKRDLNTTQAYQPWLQALPAREGLRHARLGVRHARPAESHPQPATYMGWSLKYDFDPVYLQYKIVETLDRW
jgi:predicted GTPase